MAIPRCVVYAAPMASLAPNRHREHVFTFEEYVRIAEHSPIRLEFWDGVILDMAGGSPRHSAICSNLVRIPGGQLRGRPCRAYDANLRVRSITVNRATYADATVVCGPLEIDPADKTQQTVLNPSVLFEVLSPSTSSDAAGRSSIATQRSPACRQSYLSSRTSGALPYTSVNRTGAGHGRSALTAWSR